MVNFEYENLFRQSGVIKSLEISDNDSINLTNEDIYSESLKLTESLCSEEEVVFGSVEAAKLSFTTSDTTNEFLGKRLVVYITLEDTDEPFKIGEYTVAEETLTADRTKKQIVAYDDIYLIHNTDVNGWYKSLTFPQTLKAFRDSFFDYLGITIEDTTLINDSMVVEETIDAAVLSGTDVAKAICEINGVMGHIDRNGVFRFIKLDTPGENLNTMPYYHSSGRVYRDVTYTVNADGSLSTSGTASDASSFVFHSRNPNSTNELILPNGKYRVSGCPSGGASNKYDITVTITKNGSAVNLCRDYGNGAEFELTGDDSFTDKTRVQISVNIRKNQNSNGLVFYPRIEKVLYEINPTIYKNPLEYADYTVQSITQLQIRQEENDIGVIVGTTGNSYIIEDNFLVYGKSSEDLTIIANNLLPEIQNKTYVPSRIDCIGNPCVEVGDRVKVTKRDNSSFETYVFSRELNGIQSLADTYISEGSETRTEKVNGVHYDIRQLKGKSNVLERSIEETRSTITDVERGLQTEIRQTAEGIEVQIQDLQDQIDGAIEYYERDGTPTLLNYPYWDFTSAFKCDGTKRCDAIYDDAMVEGGDQYPHFYYSEADRKNHQRDLCFDNLNAVSYRFNYVEEQWIWQEIADSETSIILSRISSLEATAESLQTEYTEISLDLTGNYYTKVETDSKITQTATQIQTTVSATYATKTTTNSLQSQITQQASQITAKVSQTGGTSSSFAWNLTSSEFRLTSNNRVVFRCNSSGITVDGVAVASEISAVKGRVTNLEADHVTVGQLNAVSARVGSLEADHVSVSDLNAVNGRFNSLNASNITAGTLSVDRLNVQSIADRFQSVRFACVAISASSAGTFANLSIYHSGVSRYATLYCDSTGYVKWR